MGAAVAPLAIAGTALQGLGQYRAGKQAYWASKFEAGQMESQAMERKAASHRQVEEIDRQGRLAQSRALAVAAASGGGASDPTVMNIMANLAGETEYRKMVALYEGESAARYLEGQADVTRWAGREARTAGKMAALGTAISGGTSLYSKYYPIDKQITSPTNNPWADPSIGGPRNLF